MSLESDLYTKLSAAAGLTAIVGDQIWPSHAAEGATAPYLAYGSIFHEGRYTLDGEDAGSRARMQFDCYAEDPDTALAMALAVIEAIPESGKPIHRAAHSIQDLGLEPGTRLFRRMVEMSIFHRST